MVSNILDLKKLIRDKQVLYGTFVKINNSAILEVLGYAGFDFVVIDTEHGSHSIESVEALVRSANLSGLCPVVRVRKNDPTLISQALDTGASGVQVPQVSTKNDALTAVNAAKFYPEGQRGMDPYSRSARYSHTRMADYLKEANEKTSIILQVEGVKGLSNLDEIITVPGIDIIFIGPYDLSQSLGLPGQVNHEVLSEEMLKVITKANKKGIISGTYIDNVEGAKKWVNLGIEYIAVSVDVSIMMRAAKQIISVLKSN